MTKKLIIFSTVFSKDGGEKIVDNIDSFLRFLFSFSETGKTHINVQKTKTQVVQPTDN